MPYLKVGVWEIRANGWRGRLLIRRIDEIGRLSGRLDGHAISGWWNERGHRLSFVVDAEGEDSSDDLAFSGYAWDELTEAGSGRSYYLAGSYDTFGGGGGAKDRETFGWFATLASTGPIPISEV